MTGMVNRHDLTHSPVGLWQFDGNLNDSSGNSFNLTAESGTARYGDLVPGISCLYSNALRLVYNTSGTALAITGDMTVEFMFRGDTPTNSYFVGYAGGSSSSTQANNVLYSIQIPSGLFGATWTQESGSGAATSYALTNRVLPRTVLCHVAATRTSNVIQFYLNGRAFGAASSALTTPDGGTTSVFRVGGDASQNAVVGNISSLKVIASSLSAAQVAAEFNRTLGPLYGNYSP